MIEFGKTLRTAREAKGYTVAQLAEMTKLNPSTVTDLENENFSRIAAPIYGRGFIKLYCEAVGLESKPLVNEFMEILNGNREPLIRERVTEMAPPEPTPKPTPEPMPEPISEPVPEPMPEPMPETLAEPAPEQAPKQATETETGDFQLEAEIQPAPMPLSEDLPSAQDMPENPATPADIPAEFPHSDPLSEPRKTQSLSRYATPIGERPLAAGLATLNPRIIVLAGLLIALLAALIFGIRALYRATTDTPADEQESTVPVEATAKGDATPASVPTPVPAKARTPQKIPDVYID